MFLPSPGLAALDDVLNVKAKQWQCYLNGEIEPACKGRAAELAAMFASPNVAVAVAVVTVDVGII